MSEFLRALRLGLLAAAITAAALGGLFVATLVLFAIHPAVGVIGVISLSVGVGAVAAEFL